MTVNSYRVCMAILIGLFLPVAVEANAPVPPNMFFCGTGPQTLTIYESEAARIFDQTLVLRDSGTYQVSVQATGFTFEGHVYARRTNYNKWTHVAKTPRGENRWTRQWRVGHQDVEAFLRMQIIKDDNSCTGCTITLEVRSECE